jgi:hypothetical protein
VPVVGGTGLDGVAVDIDHGGLGGEGGGDLLRNLADGDGLHPGIELRVEEVVESLWRDPLQSLGLRDEAFVRHIDGGLDGGAGGALADAALKEVEAALLERELDVHHLVEVALKGLADVGELFVEGGIVALELLDGRGGADAGDDVLALGVDEVFAGDLVLAGGGVAGEGDAGAGGIAHVSEDHGLDVDGGAEVVGNALDLAVAVGALVVPGVEDGADGELQLVPGVVREVVAGLGLHQGLELIDDAAELVRGELPVFLSAGLVLGVVEDAVELAAFNLEDDVGEHHDEAAVGIVGEALVAGLGGEGLECGRVEAEVEDGVHHAGHRELCAGADGNEEGVVGIAELLAGLGFDLREGVADLVHEAVGEVHAGPGVVVAGDGGDGEAGRDGKAEVGHLGEVGALASEEVLLVLVAFVEEVDVLGHGVRLRAMLARGWQADVTNERPVR